MSRPNQKVELQNTFLQLKKSGLLVIKNEGERNLVAKQLEERRITKKFNPSVSRIN